MNGAGTLNGRVISGTYDYEQSNSQRQDLTGGTIRLLPHNLWIRLPQTLWG